MGTQMIADYADKKDSLESSRMRIIRFVYLQKIPPLTSAVRGDSLPVFGRKLDPFFLHLFEVCVLSF